MQCSPIDSRRPGSSETVSSFDKKPRMIRNALSRTPLSTSVVSGHRAGRMRFATSCRRKYCCVAARASILAILAGGKESRVPRINAPINTYIKLFLLTDLIIIFYEHIMNFTILL